jgi:signal transduction histidine kinase
VYLSQPAILYRHQRPRRLWFGALIVACAVAAAAGLVANWRAFKRQQRLSELKSNFVSSVSHELRTPVASVRLLVEGLESGRVGGAAKQKEYLHLMGQECRRLSGLIENILDFSRIDDGRKYFQFSATDVETLATETVKMLEPYAEERNVPLALSIDRAASSVNHTTTAPMLDGLAIRQALLNLIDNAIKHSPQGKTVTVRVEWTGDVNGASRCVLISVEDHGPGIPAAEHEKIFERFYRRGSELNRETRGIGIGLTIVKHIVESHGGRILLRSAPGQGSRFTMELPLNQKEEYTA